MPYMTLADVTDEQRIAYFAGILLFLFGMFLATFRKIVADFILSIMGLLAVAFCLSAFVVTHMAGLTPQVQLSIVAGMTEQAFNFATTVAIPFLNSTVYPVVQKVFEEYAKR